MFNAITIYHGKDHDKFEPWLEQLQNACRVGKHDICEVAMCCASGPVLEVLQSEGNFWGVPVYPQLFQESLGVDG